MTVRKMTAKERNKMFGDGVLLFGNNPQSQQNTLKSNIDDFGFLQVSKKYGNGFSASLNNGPSVDLFVVSGLKWTSELNDAVWNQYNWQTLLEECKSVEILNSGEVNGDVFFWIAVTDPKKLRLELSRLMIATLS